MRITVKYCSASSWSLSSFSWTPISRLSLERHQQSVNLCCCCWLTTTAGAAKAPLSQIPADNSDGNFVFLFFLGFWFDKTYSFEPAQLLVLALHAVLEVQQVVDLLLERLLRRAHHRHLLVLHLQLALAQVALVDLLLQARAQARHLHGRPRRQGQRSAL